MTTISKRPLSHQARPLTITESGYVYGPRKWAIALTASLGAILEVIDTSIVNVALTDIQASLGATITEVAWVVTGYAIANVILIPLTAWLGDYFGKKNYFIFSLIGFTIASVMCGLSPNLLVLIISRILQGLCGGGLLAKAQAILFETFPPQEQAVAQAVFGVGVIAGPAIGPTLGGFLTDSLGWRWIFFVNIPFGIVAIILASIFLLKDTNKGKSQNQTVDWLGIALLTLTIGSFQTVLEEGQKNYWFESGFISTLTVVAFVGLGLFIWQELTTKHPAVDLRVLRHRSLAAGSLYSGILGMGLYGALFAVPIFAQNILRFSATQTGLLLAPGALASAIAMIMLGKLAGKVDARLLIGSGAIGMTLVMFQLSSITPQTGTDDLFWPLIWRGAVTVLMFLPLSLASLSPLPKEDISAGSGFYNLTRQLGGSVGIALLTTLLEQREAYHRSILVSHVTPYNLLTNQRLDILTHLFESRGMDANTAHLQALTVIDLTINQQSAVLSFADIFRVVGVVFFCSLPLLLFLGKGGSGGKAPSAH
ncbi:DHA2 family efflux MFS transporter permease subunit [Aetokthonos hydrillicola Thurmond2011]|jgi:DHA2 family multidrug resistance protein|uniref:DHA2 family efflux MFS transporter permease subunit n=1 Tax=Aetokthonos hydrillicola Thurmond2011 TaxID=2712845 RepID=A0AAP5I3M9_9CYAN|nr:DHA2 family efflux MFS transporter permease subunit [Aetokthonos hydrillicola]MBO3458605.1 DHA2 family efflux MFS transporter permease subunit [Aetokthonos hydrillicola CCALA 1050]MBW4585048.1 DHA2 family efflux MFS transporter permease subunit [Aetokthonos hydrillicola CCALA 1050]MDR9894191.1 DHA2 family efflux MFS transporter permease subunit [Aetokthonos hydrillicola Thurmond2011]